MDGSGTPPRPGGVADTTAMFTASEVESRVGVPATTLRQWERRYGFPSPARSASGYRLYSPHDLALIEVMQGHLRAGVPAGRAAQLTLAAEQEGGVFGPAHPGPDLLNPAGRPAGSPAPHHEAYASALLAALVGGELGQAAALLQGAQARSGVEDVLAHVMAPALVELGAMWERGEITVAHEHRASAFLRTRVSAALEAVEGGEFGPRVVAACAPGEQHEIGLLMISLVLRRRGARIDYLGANMPLGDLAVFTRQRGAQGVLLSLGGEWALGPTRRHLRDLAGLGVPVFFGGGLLDAHPELAAEWGGIYAGPTLAEAADTVTGHLRAAPPGGP